MAQNNLEDYLASLYREQEEAQERDKLAEALEALSVEQLEALVSSVEQAAGQKTKMASVNQGATDAEDAAFLQKFAEAVDFARHMAHNDFLQKEAGFFGASAEERLKEEPGVLEAAARHSRAQRESVPVQSVGGGIGGALLGGMLGATTGILATGGESKLVPAALGALGALGGAVGGVSFGGRAANAEKADRLRSFEELKHREKKSSAPLDAYLAVLQSRVGG